MVDLEQALTSLAFNDVDFVIVGGVAIKLHASGYLTEDLDFCYSRAPANISRLFAALKDFLPRPRNFPAKLLYVFDEGTLRNGSNFTFRTSIGDLDLLGEVKGLGDYSDALRRSVKYTIFGNEVRALNLDALIDSKTAADRPKDHLVLPELHALREALDPNEE